MDGLSITLAIVTLVWAGAFFWQRANNAQLQAAHDTTRRELVTAVAARQELESALERLKRERPEVTAQARRKILERIIEIDDHVHRALAHAQEAPSAVREGLQLLARELENTWRSLGMERVAPESGAPFDPARHEAIARRVADETAAGAAAPTVDVVYSAGFFEGERLLRPARVSVLMPATQQSVEREPPEMPGMNEGHVDVMATPAPESLEEDAAQVHPEELEEEVYADVES